MSKKQKPKKVKKVLLSIDGLSKSQKAIFEKGVDQINNFIELNKSFRMEIAKYIVELKEEMFGGGFDMSGYEENFVILNLTKRIDFTVSCLKQWVKVYLSVAGNEKVSESSEYKALSITEKLQVADQIKKGHKKATEIVKEHYANKNDPVKKSLFYIERYLKAVASSSRMFEEAVFNNDLSAKEKATVENFIAQLDIIRKNLVGTLMNKSKAKRA